MESVAVFIESLRWQDLLDIVLNSYILFRLYVLFRGTNVMRMFLAICLLWVLKRVTVGLGLIVTSWVIQGIIAVAALIVIIVFRNEIAAVFQKRSIKSFIWGIPQQPVQTSYEVIAESVDELANRNLGALIVLPRAKNIDEIVHGGVHWHGRLSQEMLLSVFWHGSPVHDGAAILQGDQILKVGVILPLSKDKNLPSHFGTRHRAAAGLAEQSDALIVVVSEERGEITVFQNDKIHNVRDTFELTQVLYDHLGTVSERKAVRGKVYELTAAALGCVLFIAAIWFSFARGAEMLTTIDVPVEFINRPEELKVFSATASSVKVQVSGSGSLIRSIGPEQLNARLNLANAVVGKNEISINREGIVLPPGIELKQVQPETLIVTLDVPEQKQLPIQPNWTGKLAPTLIMTDFSVSPMRVSVEGGSLVVKEIRSLYTEPIPLDDLRESGTVEAGIMLLPSSLKLSEDSDTTVKINYTLKRREDPAVEPGES